MCSPGVVWHDLAHTHALQQQTVFSRQHTAVTHQTRGDGEESERRQEQVEVEVEEQEGEEVSERYVHPIQEW